MDHDYSTESYFFNHDGWNFEFKKHHMSMTIVQGTFKELEFSHDF